jgi:hypothetical protein
MKVWNSYSSEHSANLVMIGHFKDAGAAEAVKDLIDELQAAMSTSEIVAGSDRYDDEARKLLTRLEFYSVGPSELEQFNYDFHVKLEGNDVVITTDEIEVSALMKLLFDKGARIEVYSAHEHSGTGRGRDTSETKSKQ